MARYELLYFPARGRAEQIRVLLTYKGVDFTEISPENWLEMKLTTPFRRLPVMTDHADDGDLVLAESGAIMRHLARDLGLYGSTPAQAAMCDSLADYVADERSKYIDVAYAATMGTTQEQIAKYWEQLPTTLDDLERALGRSTAADTGWFIGDELTFADLATFDYLDGLDNLKPGTLDNHPKLKAFVAKVRAQPSLETFLAERSRP